MSEQPDILYDVRDGIAEVTLNRPKALNALTHEMCVDYRAELLAWAVDDDVKAVVVRGTGGKAFCAGGDIRKLYEEGRVGGNYPKLFYSDEYRLDAAVKHFPKPYIALLNGITMGGGVGVSIHGSCRIVTGSTMFAMPETGIGLFPDVGGTYFLPRCPGEIGMYLGLTGARLKAADMVYAGLADYFVPAEKLDQVVPALRARPDEVATVMAGLAGDSGEPPLAGKRGAIDKHFAAESVETILASLDEDGSEWAADTAAGLRGKSPTSLKLTYRQIREGRLHSFNECMRLEWRMVNRVMSGHDFYEGTRAVVIDKDQAPQWQPRDLADVGDADVEAYFAPLAEGDIDLDLR